MIKPVKAGGAKGGSKQPFPKRKHEWHKRSILYGNENGRNKIAVGEVFKSAESYAQC